MTPKKLKQKYIDKLSNAQGVAEGIQDLIRRSVATNLLNYDEDILSKEEIELLEKAKQRINARVKDYEAFLADLHDLDAEPLL